MIVKIFNFCKSIFFVTFVNALFYSKILSNDSMSKIASGLTKEVLLIRLNLKLKMLEEIPKYYQISESDLPQLYRSAFVRFAEEVDLFCSILIWNRELYKTISKEIRRSMMRKVIWDLRCKGIVFDDSDLVS